MKIIAITTLYDALCKDRAVTDATRMKLLISSMLHRVAAYVIGKLQIHGSHLVLYLSCNIYMVPKNCARFRSKILLQVSS